MQQKYNQPKSRRDGIIIEKEHSVKNILNY